MLLKLVKPQDYCYEKLYPNPTPNPNRKGETTQREDYCYGRRSNRDAEGVKDGKKAAEYICRLASHSR